MKALYPNLDDELNYAVGMFVGLAIGDAMGAPIEFQPSREPAGYARDPCARCVAPSSVTADYRSQRVRSQCCQRQSILATVGLHATCAQYSSPVAPLRAQCEKGRASCTSTSHDRRVPRYQARLPWAATGCWLEAGDHTGYEARAP